MKWTPDQIIALVIVVSCVILIARGIDGEVKGILGVATGWIVARQYQSRRLKEGGK